MNTPMVQAAGRLYEQTLAPDERIPWAWIERSVGDRDRPGGWNKHLILTAPEGRTDDPAALAGYVYGAFLPGYGGYLCYVGVADWARRMGVGTTLYGAFYDVMRADAREAGETLPFVIWESHRPEFGAPEADRQLWEARVRLFDRVGGLWVEDVDFLSPNFAADDYELEPVPLQLFVRPMDEPANAFDSDRLREVIAGLHERVYRNEPGDPLFEGTLPPGLHPRLVPAKLAGAVRADRGVLV
ncbi:MAG TPA: hypothetical protein VKE74_12720 [Gemmataceae bacterium]|nr:hypothetical protein [Gemmataceae bacterium]